MPFRLRYVLAPEVVRETICCPANHSNEVVLPHLNLLLYQVALVIIWRDKLLGHDCIFISILYAVDISFSSTW